MGHRANVVVVGAHGGADPTTLGGKGAALCTLAAHGVPVPPFAVVTTAGFPRTTEPVGDELADQILRAAQEVAGTGGRLAVRSSATVEDRPGSSFAGQFRSVLNVAVPDEVMAAVHLVWESLSSASAQQYRLQRSRDLAPDDSAEPSMAVVLMRHIDAHRSGVAFTRDPGGSSSCLRVEAVEGTADRLVSGEVTPAVYRVEGEWVVPEDPVIAEVARLARRCEQIFGTPQDVEWVWDGEQVMVVQSRPITALAGAAEPVALDPARWTTAGIAEMLPGPITPLMAGTAVLAVDHALTSLLHRLGALPISLPAAGGVVICVQGTAVLQLPVLREAAHRLPSTTPERLEAQLLGHSRPQESGATRHAWGRGVQHDLRVLRMRRRASNDADIVLATVDQLAEAPTLRKTTSRTARELWVTRQRLFDLLLRTAEAEVVTAALAAAAFDRLVGFLASYLGDESSEQASALTRSGTRPPLVARWLDAAEQLRSHPLGRTVLNEESWPAAHASLERAQGGRPMIEDIERVMRRAGSRSLPGGPTWDEDPQMAWAALRAAASLTTRQHGGEAMSDHHELLQRLSATPRWRRRRALTGVVIDSQAIVLRRHVREATRLLTYRERLKDAMLGVGGEIRRVDRRLGETLMSEGRLHPGSTLDHLSTSALAQLVVAGEAAPGPPTAVLTGWAASSGRYEGWARVVASADDPFQPGEVLIARTTDPSWSPLFMMAGALAVERGGLLSHAAVIARELGLPAVVNIAGLTDRVVTGMRLRVDGRAGTVEIIDDVA